MGPFVFKYRVFRCKIRSLSYFIPWYYWVYSLHQKAFFTAQKCCFSSSVSIFMLAVLSWFDLGKLN